MSVASRGAATLVMVIVLFFVMALVAAYANRNLVVEQRVASAVLDATLAQEAAQFGLDHTLALLNADGVNEQCQPVALGGTLLRERLLAIDAEGRIQAQWSDLKRRPLVCDRAANGTWNCQCPSNHTPALVAPGTVKVWSVRVGMGPALDAPAVVSLQAEGCAQSSVNCGLGFDPSQAESTEYVDAPRMLRIGLLPALSQAPASALTVVGHVKLGGGLRVAHAHSAVSLRAGGGFSGNAALVHGAAGSVGTPARVDPALSALGADALLRRTLGMAPEQLHRHAALRSLACSGDCTSLLVAAVARGAQFIRVAGDLQLNQASVLGDAARPVMLVVDGNAHLGAAVQLHGLMVVRGHAALAAPGTRIQGAALVGGDLDGDVGSHVVWDGAALQALQTRVGSFVKLSGGEWSPL